MKEETRLNEIAGSVLVPFLVGGLVGAGVMLLLAPKAGKEIRHDFSDAAIKARDQLLTAVDKGRELFDESKTVVSEAIGAGKTAYIRETERNAKAA